MRRERERSIILDVGLKTKKKQCHYKLQKKDRKFSIASKLEYTLIQSLTIIIGLLFETWCAQFLYHTDGVSTVNSVALYIYFHKIFIEWGKPFMITNPTLFPDKFNKQRVFRVKERIRIVFFFFDALSHIGNLML